MNAQLRRSVVDFAPLLSFFAAYRISGLYAATATVMIAAVVAVCLGYWFDRKIHPVPLATAIIVLVFGGLTLYLNNETFIKMKPTMIYLLFGGVLLGGLYFKRPFVKYLFGAAVTLDEVNWRLLSRRFGIFFLAMAFLNELIWRNFSSDIWVDYHVFGAIALTVLFSMSQVPFLLKHQVEDKVPGGN
jgi:intracellular septation protein